MDLRQLEMLLAVVDAGGYQRGAERLHVAHSAVHRQIRLLETELGDRLFVRRGRQVELTAVGRLVVEGARRVAREVDALRRQAAEARRLETGDLRIGTGTTTLSYFLASVLERFRREHPGVRVRVTTGVGDLIVAAVASGGLDIGVVYAPHDMPDLSPQPVAETLYHDEFVLAVGRRHPLAERKSATLEEVARGPIILYPPASHLRRHFERLFLAHGLSPEVSMELENEEAMERMVAIEMGCAFLSKRRTPSDRVRHVAIRGQRTACEVGLVCPPGDYLPHATREFARLCREAARAQRSRS